MTQQDCSESEVKEIDVERIQRFFHSITTLRIHELESDAELSLAAPQLTQFLRRATYSDERELEHVYETGFRPQLLRAWERLYLYKRLGEFELCADKESAPVSVLLLRSLTGYLVVAADFVKESCVDVMSYEEGSVIRYVGIQIMNVLYSMYRKDP